MTSVFPADVSCLRLTALLSSKPHAINESKMMRVLRRLGQTEPDSRRKDAAKTLRVSAVEKRTVWVRTVRGNRNKFAAD
jgi:hypothetical protein